MRVSFALLSAVLAAFLGGGRHLSYRKTRRWVGVIATAIGGVVFVTFDLAPKDAHFTPSVRLGIGEERYIDFSFANRAAHKATKVNARFGLFDADGNEISPERERNHFIPRDMTVEAHAEKVGTLDRDYFTAGPEIVYFCVTFRGSYLIDIVREEYFLIRDKAAIGQELGFGQAHYAKRRAILSWRAACDVADRAPDGIMQQYRESIAYRAS